MICFSFQLFNIYVTNVFNNTKIQLLGWSREVGDLRIPHFIATHMMQLLPLLGWLLDRFKLPTKIIVIMATVILILASAVCFELALAEKSVLPV